ncbi:MAG: biopolymer transporter ExbD [Phaeospirillum sp.]|nr:biopolymer transporter ExbD [Phaeospirillum sp.]
MQLNDGNGSDEPQIMVDINTTPLIDVMLVLLIMLIITIPIQTHAVKLDLPVGPPPAALSPPPPVVAIAVEADGAVRWNGHPVPDRAALEARLAEVAAAQPELHLLPDRRAPYKHVAQILATAQQHGLKKIGIVGAEQFGE